MASPKKNNPAEDLMASLLKEVGKKAIEISPEKEIESLDLFSSLQEQKSDHQNTLLSGGDGDFDSLTRVEYEDTRNVLMTEKTSIHEKQNEESIALNLSVVDKNPVRSLFGSSESIPISVMPAIEHAAEAGLLFQPAKEVSSQDETVALNNNSVVVKNKKLSELQTQDAAALLKKSTFQDYNDQEKTVAVTGFRQSDTLNYDDKVKVAIGQNKSAYSSGYASWGGGAEASLGQAENLKMAQEKILDLEKDNGKLRLQNEELMSASEIIKERSDLLTAQVNEYKNDKENFEESFRNEIALLKGHLHRKEVEQQKSQLRIDELDSRLKFDMKKIRVRERELENRLELIRAEKNALTKSKDEQILDLRRKMDILQMEVDSYRQKCVELNKSLEVNQDSFKRTTRALRLAMANLELQEENKISPLKKVD